MGKPRGGWEKTVRFRVQRLEAVSHVQLIRTRANFEKPALLVAWLLPMRPAPCGVVCLAYLASFAAGGIRWLRNADASLQDERETE